MPPVADENGRSLIETGDLDSGDLEGPMNMTDVFEASGMIAGLVLLAFLLISAVTLILRRGRGKTWRERHPHLGRYFAIRVGIAVGIGGSAFVLITAGLVLNSHRPPADITPVVTVKKAAGPITVDLDLTECNKTIDGTISSRGGRSATVYSDQGGLQEVPLNRKGRGTFELKGATAKRGLLSCYLQLPVVKAGNHPSRVKLSLDDQMEVDTVASVPPPDSFSGGSWAWNCPAGERCPSLATVNYAIEEGTKQVIVLVLAALFGSIIALFIGEAVIEPIRQKLRRP